MHLYIVRGIPNSGKSTVGRALGLCFAADDFFEALAVRNNKTYKEVWTPTLLSKAHAECLHNVKTAMSNSTSNIAVCNTFINRKDMLPYINAARYYKYSWSILLIQDHEGLGDNGHEVPLEVIEKMKKELHG